MASPLWRSPFLTSQESSSSVYWYMSHTKESQYQPILPSETWSHANASSSRTELDAPYSGGLETNTLHGRSGCPSRSSLQDHTSSVVEASEQKYHPQFKNSPMKRSPISKEKSEKSNKLPKMNRNSTSVTCYVCYSSETKRMKDHLFLGPTQCVKCGLKCEDCLTFKLLSRSISEKCKHSLVYSSNPVAFLISKIALVYNTSSLPVPDTVLQDVSKYMDKFKVLEAEFPWSTAIQMYNEYLNTPEVFKVRQVRDEKKKINNSRPTGTKLGNAKYPFASRLVEHECPGCDDGDLLLSQNYDLLSLDQETEYVEIAQDRDPHPLSPSDPAQPKSTSAHKTLPYPKASSESSQAEHKKVKQEQPKFDGLGLLKMPEDEYYLVKTEPIEECPMCYTRICPSRFNVNVESFLVTYLCVHCELKIYFVVSPRVAILKDEPSNTIKRNIAVKKTGRPYKKTKKTKHMALLLKSLSFEPGSVKATHLIK